jgi:N6-L-threonylcarbamoyladenine synthase
MLILGLESSCDETSAALLLDGKKILANLISSQVDLHARFGGVVPEIACRKHLEVLNPLLQEAMEKSGKNFTDLQAVAVSHAPGLVGALLIGVAAAKVLAAILNIPLIGVHHLAGHIYANFLVNPEISFPLIALAVSGGHTELVYMPSHCKYQLLGSTLDDAAGEAFDKVAKVLGLGYPGGPAIDELAREGDPQSIKFPRAWLGGNLNFSFSGLKTSVINFVRSNPLESYRIEDICAAFQEAVVEVLTQKTVNAALKYQVKNVLLVGGVACNSRLREILKNACALKGLNFFLPPPELCTDNAAMIACAGYYQLKEGKSSSLDLDVYPNMSIEQLTGA